MNFRQFFIHNHWWGKILGAFFGYLIGGPAGALFGLLIGNFFDRGLIQHFSSPHWHYFNEKRKAIQSIFFEASFAIMGHIAKADGRVSEKEIQIAKTLMNEMRLSQAQKEKAKQFFQQGKAKNYNITEILLRLKLACQDNPELLKLFMDIQYHAAQSEGLSPLKASALNVVFRELGFAPLHEQYRYYEDFSRSSQQSSGRSNYSSSHQYSRASSSGGNLAQAYALLDLTPEADKHEVKRAYRRLMSRNHPDKLIAQGLPESMIKLANEKTQNIRKAYEQICASKGW